MIKFAVITIAFMLIDTTVSQLQVITDHREKYTQRHNKTDMKNYYADMGLILVGLILIGI